MLKPIITNLATWPNDKRGLPIFTSTHDAYLYAQLIEKFPDKQKMLSITRQDFYIKLRHERHLAQPNLQRMMDLAIKAQLYRECLDEVHRIKNEQFHD